MGDDSKKSFWTSLPGILTGAAALLTAIGGLLYHNQTKHPPKPERNDQAQVRPARMQEVAAKTPVESDRGSQAEMQPPEGFEERASYKGDCANPPAGYSCISFRDQYLMLVKDEVPRKHTDIGAWDKHAIMEVVGKHARYEHILGTNYVKTVAK